MAVENPVIWCDEDGLCGCCFLLCRNFEGGCNKYLRLKFLEVLGSLVQKVNETERDEVVERCNYKPFLSQAGSLATRGPTLFVYIGCTGGSSDTILGSSHLGSRALEANEGPCLLVFEPHVNTSHGASPFFIAACNTWAPVGII